MSIRQRHSTLRSELRLINLSWIFGALWLWTMTGAVMTQYARALGMPDYAFGILAALPYLATLMQLPASYLLDRFGRRKTLFLWSQGFSRLMWIVAALIPWILPGSQLLWWPALVVVLAVAWATFHMGVPAWMNWIADVVPRRVRGRFYGMRQLVARPIAVVVTLAVGAAIDLVQDTQQPHMMLRATSVILVIASLFGLLEVETYQRVHDPKPARQNGHVDWLRNLAQPLRMANFRWFVAFNMTFALGTGFMGQYVWLYMFDVGGYSNLQANLIMVALPGLVNLMVYPLWGRFVDRLGRKPVLLIAASGMLVNPFGWILLCTGAAPWLGGSIVMIGFLSWPGIEVSTMNYMFDLAGTRDEKDSGTAMVSINNIAVACGGAVSGVIGGVFAQTLGDLHWIVPGINVPLTYHGLLFLFSAVLRLVSVVWVTLIHEVEAAPTRDVIRYMTSTLYGNVRQAILMPTRVVTNLYRLSYRPQTGKPHRERPASGSTKR